MFTLSDGLPIHSGEDLITSETNRQDRSIVIRMSLDRKAEGYRDKKFDSECGEKGQESGET